MNRQIASSVLGSCKSRYSSGVMVHRACQTGVVPKPTPARKVRFLFLDILVRANKKGLKATDLPFMSGSWKGIGSTWTEQLGMVTGELSFFLVLREERITFQILQLKSTRNF